MNFGLKCTLCLLMFVPVLASAHGMATTQTKTAGNFTVEFEYNTVGNILVGDYTLYNVYLLNSATHDGVDFDSSFIRIEKHDGRAMLAGNLVQASDIKGYASLSGVLSDPGGYTAQVSFYKADKTLAEAKFDFEVEKNQFNVAAGAESSKRPFSSSAVLFLLGLVLGGGGVWLYRVYKSPKI